MQITVKNHERRTIYRSPQSPSFTCWVRLWMMPDQSIMTSFQQATGPLSGRPSAPPEVRRRLNWPPPDMNQNYDLTGLKMENIYLRSADRGQTWIQVAADTFTTCMNGVVGSGGEAALANGTILRAVWGHYLPYSDVPQNGFIQRSTDNLRTWGPPELLGKDPHLQNYPSRLRVLSDGRGVITGGVIPYNPDHWTRSDEHYRKLQPCLWVSKDKEGKSWSDPISVIPGDGGFTDFTEEWDLAEMDNGDLFGMYRSHQAGIGRLQNILVKEGQTWRPTPAVAAPFSQSGFPELLKTRAGTLLYLAPDGIWATADRGKQWMKLNAPGTGYYPRSMQLENGMIVVIAHAGGGDKPYGTMLSIIMDTFQLAISGQAPAFSGAGRQPSGRLKKQGRT